MKKAVLLLLLINPLSVVAAETTAAEAGKILADAVVCLGEPSQALDGLIVEGGTFTPDYTATGFGDEMSYKSVVVLREPVTVGDAKARTFVSEMESTNFEFAAFTYGNFEGDHAAIVKLLNLKAASAADKELGHFQRRLEDGSTCPPTIMLTPLQSGRFLLGCGWCNG